MERVEPSKSPEKPPLKDQQEKSRRNQSKHALLSCEGRAELRLAEDEDSSGSYREDSGRGRQGPDRDREAKKREHLEIRWSGPRKMRKLGNQGATKRCIELNEDVGSRRKSRCWRKKGSDRRKIKGGGGQSSSWRTECRRGAEDGSAGAAAVEGCQSTVRWSERVYGGE